MPRLSVLLGRRTTQVHDIDSEVVRVGRDEAMDVVIDNPSVSRRQVEFRREGDGWVVEDLGSSNGTFLGGERITEPRAVQAGDEIGIGKFSIIFDRVVGDAAPAAHAVSAPGSGSGGTTHIKAHEVRDLLERSRQERGAHVTWESGGERGAHYFDEAPAVLVGTGDLCDVRVPRGPKHHILLVNAADGCEVRNLSRWTGMKVKGSAAKRAKLGDGDVVEAGGLRLTFVAALA